MSDITRGNTFADGDEVNAASLHTLVDDAVINPAFIHEQAAETEPESADEFLIWDSAEEEFRKVTYDDLRDTLLEDASVSTVTKRISQTAHGLDVGDVVKRALNDAGSSYIYRLATAAPRSYDFATGAVNTTTNQITINNHLIVNGEKVVLNSSGTLPAPLVPGRTYYGKNAGTNLVELYTDLALTEIVDLSDVGSGTHTLFYQLHAPHSVGVVSIRHDADNFTVVMSGEITGLSSLTDGRVYFVDPDTDGALTDTPPTEIGQQCIPVLIATSTTGGMVISGQAVQLADRSVRHEHIAEKNVGYDHLDSDLRSLIDRNPSGERQTVLFGGMDANGRADFIAAGAGLDVTVEADSTEPVVVSFANGFEDGGYNFIEKLTSDISIASLTASSELFLYLNRDTNGVVTGGFSNRSPDYGFAKTPYRNLGHVPKLTANTVSVNSLAYNASAVNENGANQAYRAFDGDVGTYWESSTTTGSGYLQIQLPYPKVINKYSIRAHSTSSGSPLSWHFEGSNDGSSWTTLASGVGYTFANDENKEFTCTNTTSYLYYKISVLTTKTAGQRIRIAEFQLFEAIDHYYSIPEGIMWVTTNNGSSWTEATRVFIGEVRTGAATVSGSNVVTYALRGQYVSEVFSIADGGSTSYDHKIGNPFLNTFYYLRETSRFPWTQFGGPGYYFTGASSAGAGLNIVSGDANGDPFKARNHAAIQAGNRVIITASLPLSSVNNGNGEAYFIMRRAF